MNRQKVKDFILTRLKQKKPHELHPISRVPLCRLLSTFSNRVKRWRGVVWFTTITMGLYFWTTDNPLALKITLFAFFLYQGVLQLSNRWQEQ